MKFCYSLTNLKTARKPRFIWANIGGTEQVSQSQDAFTKALERLENKPLLISMSDVTHLNRGLASNSAKMTGQHRRQFSELINHHIDRMRSGSEIALPSQLLFAIMKSPQLGPLLSLSQAQAVNILLKTERKRIEEISNKDASRWTPSQSLRVMRSYQHLWGSRTAGEKDPLYQKITEQLLTRTRAILDQYERNGAVLEPVEEGVTGQKKILSKERYFLLEAYKNLPTDNYWKGDSAKMTSDLLKKARREIKDKIMDGGKFKNVPENLLFWELIADEFGAQSGEKMPPEIKQFVERTQKTRFLQQLRSRPMSTFGPAELRFLKEIKEEVVEQAKAENKTNNWEQEFLDYIQESEHKNLIEEINSDLAKEDSDIIAAKKRREENKKILEEYESDFKKDLKVYSETAVKTLQTAVKKCGNKSLVQELETLLEKAKDQKSEKEVLSFADKIWYDDVFRKNYVPEGKATTYEGIENEGKKIKEDLQKANLSLNLEKSDRAEILDALTYFTDTTRQIQQIDDNHKSSLLARTKAKKLTVVDLDLIRRAAESQLGAEALEEKYNLVIDSASVTKFGTFCDKFSKKIAEKAGLELISEANDVAKIEAVDDILKDRLTLLSTVKSGGLNEQVKGLAKQFDILPSTLIDFMVYSVRQKVANQLPKLKLSEANKSQSKIFDDFLANYSRQHAHLYDHDQLKSYQSHDAQYERTKKQLNRTSEDQRTAINQTFAKTTQETIQREVLMPRMLGGKNAEACYRAAEAVLVNQIEKDDLKLTAASPELLTALGGALEPFVEVSALKDAEFMNSIINNFLVQRGHEEILVSFDQSAAYWLSGNKTDRIAELDRAKLGKLFSPMTYQSHIMASRIKDNITKVQLDTKNEVELTKSMNQLVNEFNNTFKTQWGNLIDQFYDELKNYLEDKYGKGAYEDFIEDQKEDSHNILKGISEKINELKNTKSLNVHNSGFSILQGAVAQLNDKFDFQAGEWKAESQADLTQHVESLPDTADFIRTDLGLYQLEGRNKAEAVFNEKNEAIQQELKNYCESAQMFIKYADKDIKNLSDKAFEEAYGQMSRELLSKFCEESRNGIIQFTKLGEKFGDSEFYAQWYKKYSDPSTRNAALTEMNIFKGLGELLEEGDVKAQTKMLGEMVKHYKDDRPENIKKILESFGGWQIRWYSVKSIGEIVKRYFESRGKKIQRRDDKMTAELGRRIFGDSETGQEFQRLENEKFEERVGEFKKRHERELYPTLMNIIRKTKDEDELFAVVEIMMDKAWMRFDDPDFFRALMRFQKKKNGRIGTPFDIPGDVDRYVTEPEMIKIKIERAFMSIWDDHPAWLRWKTEINHKCKSQMDAVGDDYEEAVQSGGVDRYLQGVIEQWRNGEEPVNFEPSRFEGYIYKSFENAQMNGPSHRRLYYLVMGLGLKHRKTGKTILSPQAYRRLALPLFNQVPYLDALTDSSSWKKDGMIVPEGTPGAVKRAWSAEDFQGWIDRYFTNFNSTDTEQVNVKSHQFLTEVLLNSDIYMNRINKADLEKVDRDDYGSLIPGANYDRMRELWTKASGARTKVDIEARFNFLTEFKTYQTGVIESYHKDMARTDLDKNSPEFQEWKQKRLIQIGNMIRVMFMSVNKLTGNYNIGDTQPPAELDRRYWDDPNSDCNQARNLINQAVEGLGIHLDEGIKTLNVVKEDGGWRKDRRSDEEQQIHSILSADEFFDLAKIENYVDNFQAPADIYAGFGEIREESDKSS